MKPIKILYWTQLTFDNVQFNPVFFIKPTIEAVSYIKQHGFLNVPIRITGTNKLYDGFGYATFDIATMPGGCPNDFQDSNLLYSVALRNTVFTVYPYEPFIGKVQIIDPIIELGQKQVKKSETKKSVPAVMGKNPDAAVNAIPLREEYLSKKPDNDTPPPSPHSYTLILCFLLLILVVLILCFYGDLRSSTS
jgi:hypothetical protein